jgi:hypothetical protein
MKEGLKMSRQVKFIDYSNPEKALGGILFENGDVLCACCGGIFPMEEEYETFEIVNVYDNWIDFSENIIDEEG